MCMSTVAVPDVSAGGCIEANSYGIDASQRVLAKVHAVSQHDDSKHSMGRLC